MFYQHCEFTFGGPLSKCTEKEKICNLMSFVGDKGREIYLTFQWETVRVGTGESAQDVNERDILERVVGKFKATPVVHGPRRQPAALLPKITAKLKEMEKEGHLAKVSQPTDWVNSMVVSSRGEKIRICLDPGDLNKAVKREHYPIPTVEEIAAKIPEAKVFTVLDAKSGYLQMKLDYESSLLTTMNTPIGRYRWLKLPFGIKSAPELYQRAMDEMLEDIDHAYAIMDDILIAGRDIAHHDSVLNEVLHRART